MENMVPCKLCGCTDISQRNSAPPYNGKVQEYRMCEACGFTTAIETDSPEEGDFYWNKSNGSDK